MCVCIYFCIGFVVHVWVMGDKMLVEAIERKRKRNPACGAKKCNGRKHGSNYLSHYWYLFYHRCVRV